MKKALSITAIIFYVFPLIATGTTLTLQNGTSGYSGCQTIELHDPTFPDGANGVNNNKDLDRVNMLTSNNEPTCPKARAAVKFDLTGQADLTLFHTDLV